MTDQVAAWKIAHANEAESYVFAEGDGLVPILDRVVREFAENMGFEYAGLPRYGLVKIVAYTAHVVLARARGFDPELLRLTNDEVNAQMLTIMDALAKADVPVIVPDGEQS